MGNNSFAPWSTNPQCFIVQNVSPYPKTIFIFNYPINFGGTRDLLRIPGVAESDIRSSLLKGELNHKIRQQEIVVLCSDIDLTQYNATQKAFLESAGITNGLEPGPDGALTPAQHETLRQLIHFVDNGPADGFASGAFREILPSGNPFPTSITWYTNASKSFKIVEKLIVYDIRNFPFMITWNMYDTDGVTVIHTITDTITYNAAFESTRTRTIS